MKSAFRQNLLAICATIAALLVVVVDAGAILGVEYIDKPNPSARGLSVKNESGRKCDMFWVNTFKSPEEYVPQFTEDGVTVGLPYGAEKAVSSYIGHTFEIRELPTHKKGQRQNQCIYNECRKVRYTVSKRNNQKIIINKDFTVTVQDDLERAYSKVDDIYIKCQEQVSKESHSDLDALELVTECIEEAVKDKIASNTQERAFQSKVHRHMAEENVPFICVDVNKTQSIEIKNETWSYRDEAGVESYTLRRVHHLPTSEIFVVDDFVTAETCDALKIYREDSKNGNGHGVPIEATMEQTKQGKLLLNVYYKMYQLLVDRYTEWKQLEFDGEFLFDFVKDPLGFQTPSHLCVTQEDVDEVVLAMEAGKPKKCLIPGGVPESGHTKHVVVEEGMSHEEKSQKRQLAQMFLFCDEPKDQLGALHFPYAAVHVTPKPGKLVVAVHRHEGAEDHGFDGYANEYHLCPNHEVFVHTVYDHDPPKFVPPTGDDEGEL